MKLIHATIVFLLYSFLMPAQSIPGYLYYNTIQDNAAYAGQDSFSIIISSNINADYVKPKEERLNILFRQAQLFTTFDLKEINSGAGLYAEYNAFGDKSENIYERQYRVGILYNYNLILSNDLKLRVGGQLNEITANYVYKVNLFPPYLYQISVDGSDEYEISKSYLTFDPAVWMQYKKINAGFAVKNIFFNDIESRIFSLSAFYDRIRTKIIDIVFAIKIDQYKPKYGSGLNVINPQINFEFAKAILINFGYIHYSNNNFETKFFTLGFGAKISSHLSLLLNFKNAEEHDQYISGMLKMNF